MWFLDIISLGYERIPVASREIFRCFFGVAVIWKFTWDIHWGGYRYFEHGTFVRWRHERQKRHLKLIPSPSAFHVFYVLRYIAAWLVLAGFWSQYGAVIIALWCAFEFTFDRKFHTQFLFLGALYLAISPGTACLSVSNWWNGNGCVATTSSAPTVLFVFAIVIMYFGSVFVKLRSPQFLAGDVLYRAYSHYAHIAKEMRYVESGYPRLFLHWFVWVNTQVGRKRWKPLSIASLVLEILTPLLLLFDTTWVAGFLLGSLMHIGFWLLFPKRLLPFSLAVVGGYFLFLDPWKAQTLLVSLGF